MTQNEFEQHIRDTAENARKRGDTVVIEAHMSFVAVRVNSGVYSFQGDVAHDLLAGVPNWAIAEDFLLWQAQGW